MSAEPVGELVLGRVLVRALAGTDSLVVAPAQAAARIEWRGPEHAILAQAPGDTGSTDWLRTRLVLGPAVRRSASGLVEREVLIDGWLVGVEVEPERRAALRARARRAGADARDQGASELDTGRPTDVRAELPGRIAAIGVALGDAVTAGQSLLVIEAMKMLNELRAPRAGVVDLVAVAPGQGVELGDLLVRLR